MNFVFTIITISSLVLITYVNPDSVLSVLTTGVQKGLTLIVTLFTIYSVWLTVLKLIKETNLDCKIAKLFNPIISRLFKNSKSAHNEIAINMTANFLGMGGAGTKAGINAIKLMDNGKNKVTTDMIMLFVINCTSIQLIPSTIISLRSSCNSLSPSDIILPSLINTIITTTVGITLVKIISSLCSNKHTLHANNSK